MTYIIRTQAIEKSYDIVLLDNWDKFWLVKTEHRYQFILKEISFEEENEVKSDYFTKEELFPFFGAMAEMEREVINECVESGVESARARGREGGRKKRDITPSKIG